MKTIMNSRLVFLAVLFGVLPLHVQAQTALAPNADAYVRDGSNAGKNFGKATTLQVGASTKSGNNYDSYLRFDLSAIPAFAQARLRLFAGLSASGSVTTGLYTVSTTTWSETSITWNNKPARGALLGSAAVKSKSSAAVEIDLTAYLLSERAQGRNVVSLALHSATTSSILLKANSKDASANKPQLIFIVDKAPSVSLSAPLSNSVIAAPATINLAVVVSDSDGSIAKVQYFQGATPIGTATNPPYSYTWNNVAAGRYSLTAKATDNSGVSTVSAAVNVVIDTPPSVSVTSPADHSSFHVPAAFDLSASASDTDGSVAKVQFYQDSTLLKTLTQAPYTVSVNQGTPGTYTYFAKATDNAGIATQSSTITVTVRPHVAPTVTLTTPLDGARFRAPAAIVLNAVAVDSDGPIVRVDFFQENTLLGSVSQPPYSIALNPLDAGTYSFSARAVDDVGLVTQSAIATVTVAGAAAMYYIHADHIDTPRVVTDQAAKVVWRWDTADPFGASAPDEDPDGDGIRFTLNLRFPGQYFDRETGLHYNYFRDYDPGTGRYVESDPIGLSGGINTYGYAYQNPIGFADPTGQWVWLVIPGLCAAGGCELLFGGTALWCMLNQSHNLQSSSSSGGDSAAEPSNGEGKQPVVEKDKKRFFDKGQKERARDRSRDADGDPTCEYCGVKTTNESGKPNSSQGDHIESWVRGGKTTDENAANSCARCNSSKGSKELGTEWIPPRNR